MKRTLIVLWFWCLSMPLLYPLDHGVFCGVSFGQTDTGMTNEAVPGFWDRLRNLLNKNEEARADNQSVTEKYGTIYNWIHREEIHLYDSLSKTGITNWDQYQNIITVQQVADKGSGAKLAPNIKVFGWHPYWMGDAYKSYRFNLLSYIAWFCYNIDPETGACDNPSVMDIWQKSGALVDSAHQHGCKVLLTITNHTEAGNAAMLKNPDRQEVLINNLIQQLKAGRGDGIDVNFENIGDGLEQELSTFLIKLSQRLRQSNPGYVLTVDLPVYDFYNNYEIKKLLPWVNLFIVTGYDYYNGKSRTDGPVAPLFSISGGYSIQHSVDKYLQSGLKREQIILGLPYYGALWTSQSSKPGTPDSTLRFVQHLTYRALRARYCTVAPGYDKERWSAYYAVFNPDSNYYEKCWFDDTLTLKRKFDWALEQQLGGVGVWALGYDNGYPEMWNLIEKTYAADTVLVYKDPYLEQRIFRLPRSLIQYRSLIAVAGIFIVVFLFAGLVVALFDWRVREVFFKNKTLRLMYAVGGVAVLFAVYAFYLYVTEQSFRSNEHLPSLAIGLVAGAAVTLLIGYWFDKKRTQLP